jgi:dienelactone hydrolase
MVTDKGQVKIMDFGLAKVRGGAQFTKVGTTLGTAAYMSPQQARGEELDQRSDIWSFGVVLYEMLTGELPFKGDYEQAVIYAILNEEPEPLARLRQDAPEPLRQIVEKALQKNREERYATASELLRDLKDQTSAEGSASGEMSLSRLLRKPAVAVPIIFLVVGLVALLTWTMRHNAKVRWARQEVLPQIETLVEKMQGTERKQAWAAFELVQQIETIIPDEPLLKQLRPKIIRSRSIHSQPQGARVFAKAYADSGQAWYFFGQTPLDSLPFPLGFSRIMVEKKGYRTFHDLVWNTPWFSDTLRYELTQADSASEEMQFVPNSATWFDISAAPAGLHMPGLEQHPFVPVGDFLMDRFEVTNREYQRFVDAGGYQNRAYWKYPFRKDNRELTWEEAMALFVDKTGQPGPSTWEVGDSPEGQAAYPVTGVSWYEANAYAEFVGKSLPTVYHWDRVAFTWASPAIVPLSNLTAKGLLPAGTSNSMNRFGIFDLAGNVREWCVNQSSRGGRFILGGGWNDPAYAFNDAYAQSAFDRSATNGFRCIRYLEAEANHADLEQTINLPFRDFMTEKPVSDATFELFLRQYAYDKIPLNAAIESEQDSDDWIRQKIIFDAAYGTERMLAYLFLPKTAKPPFQTVIYFPGSGAIHTRSSESLSPGSRDFILKSGRALMYPIYKSTYERGDALRSDYPNESNFWKEHVIMWTKDFSRAIDYLETREDIDADKLVYYGASWGGAMGGISPAVEKRIKGSVLLVAGLLFQPALPEVEPVNFLPRITMPVLMLNGKYDFFFPYETSQRPFFEIAWNAREGQKAVCL